MNYLLDTSALSVLDPARAMMQGDFLGWLERHEPLVFASTMSIAEIEQGIAKLRRTSDGQKRADALARWRDDVIGAFGVRLLPLDVETARLTGEMSDALRAEGEHPGLADVIIAATARVGGLTVITSNERHFALLNVRFQTPQEVAGG